MLALSLLDIMVAQFRIKGYVGMFFDNILSSLFDLRLPLTFSLGDCSFISDIICECAERYISDGSDK